MSAPEKSIETDTMIRDGRYRVEVADLATLRSAGRLFWDAIGHDVTWSVAEGMLERERHAGGSARAISLETGEVVPEPVQRLVAVPLTNPITGALEFV